MSVDNLPPWDGIDLAVLLSPRAAGENRFSFPYSESNLNGEVFGGQYLGQALSAALEGGGGKSPQSMHAYFLRAARADRCLEAHVQHVREGRTFAHRRVTIMQDERIMFCADVSLHDEEATGLSHQCAVPDVPPPESLRSIAELLAAYGEHAIGAVGYRRMARKMTAELRPVDPLAGFVQAGLEPRSAIWLRAQRLSCDTPRLHYAALAYLSDLWANAPCRITHGRTLFNGETTSVSLSHCIWFHRPPSATDWLLYTLDSPSTHGGTGFSRGLLFDRKGRLIASTAQEALVRSLE